jgi:MBG domain (YGX type)/Bacterial Ig domain/MBG domain
VATTQTVQLGWNSPQLIALAGAVGQNCNSSDTLTYAIQSQPLHGTLSVLSGNSVTYTPNSGFSGLDSFTFNLTDTTNSTPLSGAVATVNLVVSATGVTPTLSLSCPAVTYDLNPHGCATALTPFVAGTTTISYNGSPAAPAAAGSYPISANFVSSGSSSQNASATGVLVISQATPTLTVLCPAVPFTGSPQGCTASATGIGTTAAVSGTISIIYNGSSTPPTNGGTYAALASFASGDPNYANTTATSSLTINEPLVTITANSQTMTFGAALPSFTYTVSPSIPLQQYPVCTSSATGASNVGTYAGAITCSGAAKVGVLFAYVAGSMTVQPAAATVTANNQTMVAGATVPTLTYANTSGLTFTTAPACTTTATSSSPAGTYPISCAGAVTSNYNVTYVGGIMTVSVAPTTPNNVPMVANLSPMTAAAAGSANLTLTVTGGSFVSGSSVLWNGKVRATTFVSPTQLTATILASDLSAVGTADVAVFNPAPGGGSSTSLTFSIDSPQQAQGAFTVTESSPTVTVPHGQSATTSLIFSALPQGAAVSAVCYNLPALGYCNYGSGTLTIGTNATTQPGTYHVLIVCSTSGAVSLSNRLGGIIIFCGLLGFPIGLLMLYRGRRLRFYGLSLLSVLFLMVATGCGGSGSNPNSPVVPAQASTAFTLTVQ